jgi:hypothetical protein
MKEHIMTTTYDPKITALLCVDFYNDFLSEGGKLWPWVKDMAKEVPRPFQSCSPFSAARLPAPRPVRGWVSSAWCYRSQCSQG